jgi:hypothetical protein
MFNNIFEGIVPISFPAVQHMFDEQSAVNPRALSATLDRRANTRRLRCGER